MVAGVEQAILRVDHLEHICSKVSMPMRRP
jgi:hypothetical protein